MMDQVQRVRIARLPRRRFLQYAMAGGAALTLAGSRLGAARAAAATVGQASGGVTGAPAATRKWTADAGLMEGWRTMTTMLDETPGAPIDATRRAAVIDKVLLLLEERYVFPDVAVAMGASVRRKAAAGEYDALADPAAFAATLTDDLRAVSRDKHLSVRYNAILLPLLPPPTPDQLERVRQELALFAGITGYGFGRVERLPGNIGYLEQRSFGFPPEFVAAATASAMTFLADTFAMIVDLRQNTGGDPATVAQLVSYFLDPEPVLLNRIHYRADNRTVESYTLRDLPSRRYGTNKRLYLLTSRETPSAAEEFAYDLQALGRATIVGEVTWGGANPAFGARVDENFQVVIPAGLVTNAITGTNWEGVGVQPDWAVPAADALRTAQVFALNNVLADFGADERPALRHVAGEARQALAELGG